MFCRERVSSTRTMRESSIQLSLECTTPEFVEESIASHNYQKALIAAIQLRNAELIRRVVDAADNIDFLVRSS